jgi:hypothetical protein
MSSGWDPKECHACPHFKSSVSPKGYKWSCAMNGRTVHEKQEFYWIWAENHLIQKGKLHENARSRVVVDYLLTQDDCNPVFDKTIILL